MITEYEKEKNKNQNDVDTIRNIDLLINEYKSFTYSKYVIIQTMSFYCAAIVTLFFKNLWILNKIVSIGSVLGFLGVYIAQQIRNKRLHNLLKDKSLAQHCFYQGALNDPQKMLNLSMEKMFQMRNEALSHKDFIEKIQDSANELIGDPIPYPGALAVFYKTIAHYRTYSFFESIQKKFFPVNTDQILDVHFWAKIYCQAALENDQELINQIHNDWISGRIDASVSQGSFSFVNAVKERKKMLIENHRVEKNQSYYQLLNQVDGIEVLTHMEEPEIDSADSFYLKIISFNRIFGFDLVLNLEDVRAYLTRQVLLANQMQISMGAAATGTFLGLSITTLIPIAVGIGGLIAISLALRLAFRIYLRGRLAEKNLSELVQKYYFSQDDRWASLIHLKIGLMLNKPSHEVEDIFKSIFNENVDGVLKKKNIFFYLYHYVSEKKLELSYEVMLALKKAGLGCDDPEIRDLSQKFMPALDNPERYKEFILLESIAKKRHTLEKWVFPVNTALNSALSFAVLGIPLTAVLTTCIVTVIPAISILAVGLSFFIYDQWLKSLYNTKIKEVPFSYMLTQTDSPFVSQIFHKKLKSLIQNPSCDLERELTQDLKNCPENHVHPSMKKYFIILKKHLDKPDPTEQKPLHAPRHR